MTGPTLPTQHLVDNTHRACSRPEERFTHRLIAVLLGALVLLDQGDSIVECLQQHTRAQRTRDGSQSCRQLLSVDRYIHHVAIQRELHGVPCSHILAPLPDELPAVVQVAVLRDIQRLVEVLIERPNLVQVHCERGETNAHWPGQLVHVELPRDKAPR